MSAIAAGGVAAGAAALASSTFKYNRANYQYDEGGRRFARYTTGFNMAQAQTKMYREDIEDLTKMTVTKQDTYHTIGTIFFVLNFQLIMAGRLGVHGPSPPGWLLGLYWTNICIALMFLVIFTWMAMHASARAQAGAAFLRTRVIRLPIPSPKQLDQARTTGNRFEKQRVGEMFRVPLVMPPAADMHAVKSEDDERRIPRWYQEDEVKELHGGEGGPLASETINPEHFELHRGLQEEWWGYDVYARLGVFFFMTHWLSSASLYSMCHIFTELRCIWPAWTVTAVFVASQYGILELDIINPGEGMKVEKYVPLVPFFALAGMTVDYSVITPSRGAAGFVYLMAIIGYCLQLAWAFRLYQLAKPCEPQKDVEEQPGKPWTPKEWRIPQAFKEMVYVVSAPKKNADTQKCLTHELKAGKAQQQTRAAPKVAQGGESANHAWKLFRGGCISAIAMWILIICGRIFEAANGERQLLKQEGRVERWPSHIQPWMPPWSRKGIRNEWCHAGGCDRRLSQEQADVSQMAQKLISVLNPLADAFEAHGAPQHFAKVDTPLPADLAWPLDFHPEHLAAREDNLVAALTRNRRGALLKVMDSAASRFAEPEPFELHGIDAFGDVSGCSLTHNGLVVTTHTGILAECAGLPVQGVWRCSQLGPKLPTFGSSLKAAVASRIAGTKLFRAAIALAEEATLLILEADEHSGSWLPAGEVRVPAMGDQMHLSLSPAADAVYVSSGNGEVLKWAFGSPEPIQQVPAWHSGPHARWHSSCPFGGNHLVQLGTRHTDTAPKLYVMAAQA